MSAQANFDAYREQLSTQDWDPCFETGDIDEICKTWTNKFMEISKNKIPNKKVTVHTAEKTWYNNYLGRLKRLKDRQYNQAVRINTPDEWNRYRAAKTNYFTHQVY